jgi:hypothetical protein
MSLTSSFLQLHHIEILNTDNSYNIFFIASILSILRRKNSDPLYIVCQEKIYNSFKRLLYDKTKELNIKSK